MIIMMARRPSRSAAASALVGVLLLLLSAGGAWAQEVIDRVAAVVAGDLIMLSDVRAARQLGLVDPGGAADADRAVLAALIERALILDEVDRYAPPEPSAEAVERALGAIQTRLGPPEKFADALSRVGTDEQQLRDRLRQDLRIRAYLDQRFTADTPEHGQAMIEAWVTGLRRRAEIVDLYQRGTQP